MRMDGRTMKAFAGVCLCCAAVLQAKEAGQAKDLSWFLDQLVNLDGLIVPAAEGVRCQQASSYDRASRYDEQTGKYINWAANGDRGHYIRIDEQTGEAVMAEINSPGCIWRIWSANPQGIIRFYFDGEKVPGFEYDFNKLFRKGESPFPSPLVWQRRVDMEDGNNPASNLYMPIPFAKSCIVTADKPHEQYYHIGYTTYPEGCKIQTFNPRMTTETEKALKRVCQLLTNSGQDPQPVDQIKTIEATVTLEPGKRMQIADLTGPAIIRQFHAKLGNGELWATRKVLLQMHWDGQATPAVDAPLGDFFGDAWQEAEYKSLPLGITKDMNYCYWRMPFAKSARIVVINQGQKPVEFKYKIVYKPGELSPDSLYFHAKWRRDMNSEVFDYPMLECTGRGRFVGDVLFPDNILGGWWGEGDEKIYVDGEKFPSTFGTGSEDYYGDAWGIRYFANAFHGCPTPDPVPRRQSCYRWHIADNIPFAKSFKIDMENYAAHHAGSVRNDYSSMAYWYMAPGGRDFFATTTAEQRIPQGKVIPDAIEAEHLLSAADGNTVSIVEEENLPVQLSRGKGVRVSGPIGTSVIFNLPAPDEGRYTIQPVLADKLKASSFELLLNGKPAGDKARLVKTANPLELKLTGKPIEGDRCEVIVDGFILHPYQNFVRDWYVIGPFPNTQDDPGFDQAFGPEQAPFDPQATFTGKNGRQVSWRKIHVSSGVVQEQGKYFDDNNHMTAYGYCEVISPDDRDATLYVGSDDGVKVFVNGRQVHGINVPRGMRPDQDKVDIRLNKGRNAILVKLLEIDGVWEFILRVNDPDDELKYNLP